jgi:hypothetical protein
LDKHANLSSDGLRVLVLEKAKDPLPAVDKIAGYDIVLFSKTRFEQEAKDGLDDKVPGDHAYSLHILTHRSGAQ